MTNPAEEVEATYQPLIEHLGACQECATFPLCPTGEGLYRPWRQALSAAWREVTQADPARLALHKEGLRDAGGRPGAGPSHPHCTGVDDVNHGSATALEGPEVKVSGTSDTDPPHMRVLPGVRQSASAAREFVREFLAHHVPGASADYVDSVVLVTSELVTNAYRYGTEPGDSLAVVLDADAASTRIEVRDPVRRHPRRQPNSPHRERGRGLVILDALCPGAWGVTDRPFGKATWAEVQAPNATTRETGNLRPLTSERT